jgi:hypothetical protein
MALRTLWGEVGRWGERSRDSGAKALKIALRVVIPGILA